MRAVRSGPFRCRVDNVSHFCALGRHDEAEPLARLGRQLGDEQDALTPALWRQVQALVDAHRGQHTQAQQLSGEAVAISERTDALNWQGDALCDLAEVLHAAGQADEAASRARPGARALPAEEEPRRERAGARPAGRAPGRRAALSVPVAPERSCKLAVVIERSLAVWQKTNVTAFLVSGIAGTVPGVVGEPYRDASGNEYLPMFVQPVLVYAADAAALRRAYERAMSRGVTPAIYTDELFTTDHDEANRAAVAEVPAEDLDLVGIAFRAERKTVDKVVDQLRFHP